MTFKMLISPRVKRRECVCLCAEGECEHCGSGKVIWEQAAESQGFRDAVSLHWTDRLRLLQVIIQFSLAWEPASATRTCASKSSI